MYFIINQGYYILSVVYKETIWNRHTIFGVINLIQILIEYFRNRCLKAFITLTNGPSRRFHFVVNIVAAAAHRQMKINYLQLTFVCVLLFINKHELPCRWRVTRG